MNDPIWTPSRERINASRLAEFAIATGRFEKDAPPEYARLWQYSVESPNEFWRAVWDFCGIIGQPGERIFEPGDHIVDARFFPDASLNFAENLMRQTGPEPALISIQESGARRTISHDELRALVSQMQQALRALGVGPGVRVAGYLPNIPEAVAAMLAAASLGAVWSSCSPDFGLSGVLDRFSQIEPKVIFCADGYQYNGKSFSSLPTVGALAEKLASVQAIVVVPFLEEKPDISALGNSVMLMDLVSGYTPGALTFTPLGFSDPLYIMFSSGTTGVPKCIVHSVGGTLIQHLKEHQLQCDIKPGDRLFYFTTCGWMMWNWQLSALASGAALVLFDGSPFFPDGNRMADILEAEEVAHFGTSAKYIDSCEKAGISPIDNNSFPALRSIFSTGSPLSDKSFDYIYTSWKPDVFLASIAGGTDILGCFVGGNPISPVFRGQCQCRLLGMDVHVYDDQGAPKTMTAGELICSSAHPSMPIGFLNDDDGRRYLKSYFDRFPGLWCQGDWVMMTPEEGFVFHGRSDATLNPGGVRIGSAEIYRQVESMDEVNEALVIGQNWNNDVRVVLFVTLQPMNILDDALNKRIKKRIMSRASPRHVPAVIIEVIDLPRTKSGKIVELAVRDVVHGRPVQNIDSLVNPQALEQFRNRKELA